MFARLTTIAIAATLVSSQAFASGEFEYTISEPTTAAVTTFGTTTDTMTYGTTTGTTTYQSGSASTQGQLDVYQTQPVTTIDTTNGTNAGFGELVYDTQPYFGANGGAGETIAQPYNGTTIQPYSTQPYTTTN